MNLLFSTDFHKNLLNSNLYSSYSNSLKNLVDELVKDKQLINFILFYFLA